MSCFVFSPSATVMTMRFSFDSMPRRSIMLCTAVPRPCMTTVIGSFSSAHIAHSVSSASGLIIDIT